MPAKWERTAGFGIGAMPMIIAAVARLHSPTLMSKIQKIQINGGDGGIRTLGTVFTVRRFSKPLVSATHPRLQIAAAKGGYSEGYSGRQVACWTFLGARGPLPHRLAKAGDSLGRKTDSPRRPWIATRHLSDFSFRPGLVRTTWQDSVACDGKG